MEAAGFVHSPGGDTFGEGSGFVAVVSLELDGCLHAPVYPQGPFQGHMTVFLQEAARVKWRNIHSKAG